MKTFVADDYQVTLMDSGDIKVDIEGITLDKYIYYYPDMIYHWFKYDASKQEYTRSGNITGLELPIWKLRILRKALEVIGKQDLFDKEIIFLDKEGGEI